MSDDLNENEEEEILPFDKVEPDNIFELQKPRQYSIRGIEFELQTQAQINAFNQLCNPESFRAQKGEKTKQVVARLSDNEEYSWVIQSVLKAIGYKVTFSRNICVTGIKSEKHNEYENLVKTVFRGVKVIDTVKDEF